MSQRDGFASGFLAGAIFGGVVGGVLGVVLTSRRDEALEEDEQQAVSNSLEGKKALMKRKQMKAVQTEGMDMEVARRSLEDKIAQLNATIDEVRQQLGSVNGSGSSQQVERAASSSLSRE